MIHRFKLDENLPSEVADLLRSAGHDAATVTEEALNGKADSLVAQACRKESRALVTLDLDFSDIRAYPPASYAGIVIFRGRAQTIPAITRLASKMLAMLDQEELQGRLWIVDESQLRVRGDDPDEP